MRDQGKEKSYTFGVSVRYTYEVLESELQKHYDTTDLAEAVRIDQTNFSQYPYMAIQDLKELDGKFEVEVNVLGE